MLTDQELDTVLAALRNWQTTLDQGAPEDLMELATRGGDHAALSVEQINALCERLNCAPVLKAWTCTDHETHYPVGGASVVVASNHHEARKLLFAELAARGLKKGKAFTLAPLDLTTAAALVLCDGNY